MIAKSSSVQQSEGLPPQQSEDTWVAITMIDDFYYRWFYNRWLYDMLNYVKWLYDRWFNDMHYNMSDYFMICYIMLNAYMIDNFIYYVIWFYDVMICYIMLYDRLFHDMLYMIWFMLLDLIHWNIYNVFLTYQLFKKLCLYMFTKPVTYENINCA